MQSQQPQPSQSTWTPLQDAKQALVLLCFLSRIFAFPVEVVLRVRMGVCYGGIASVFAIIVIPVWTCFFPWPDGGLIILFWFLQLFMQLRGRIESLWRFFKDKGDHSRYNGSPRLASLFKRTPEISIKRVYEPILVLLLAATAATLSPSLASYLAVAAFALIFNNAVIDAAERGRLRELNDGLLEQQQLAERFRELRQDF